MKITLDLNEREVAFLKQYAAVYDAERKDDITADPLVVVENRVYVPSASDYSDKTIYVLDDELEFDTLEEVEAELYCTFSENDKQALEDDGEIVVEITENDNLVEYRLKAIPVIKKYEPVAYFMTRFEADRYVEYQGHNLHHPRVFTRNIGYANYGDLAALLPMLLKLGKELSKEDSNETKEV